MLGDTDVYYVILSFYSEPIIIPIIGEKTGLEVLRSLSKVVVVVVQLLSPCLILCHPVDCSTPGFPVLHHLPELAQTRVPWVSDTIQPSHPLPSPNSSCLQSFPASGSFLMSQLFASSGKSIGALTLASVLPMNIQGWFPFRTDWFDLLVVQGTLKNLPEFLETPTKVLAGRTTVLDLVPKTIVVSSRTVRIS